jgi:2-keto-4-pentenoate hydratase
MMTGAREEQLISVARMFEDARRTNTPITDLPEELRPDSLDEAYYVQDRLSQVYGEVGGWKVGAPTAEATPVFAPMPKAWMGTSGSTMGGGIMRRFRGLEAEIAFLMGKDLPRRETPYTREEVVAAITSCHPVIEVLESGLTDPRAATRLSTIGDLQMHGGFVYGPAYEEWKSVDFLKESVALVVDGVVRVERMGSNTSGDLMRLLPWLANEGAARTGGLKAGQWVTTGSWSGVEVATAGARVEVTFSTVGKVAMQFA